MFKALLIETIPGENCDLRRIATASGVDLLLLQRMLDPASDLEPTRQEYANIVKAIPVSIVSEIGAVIPDEVKDDIDYLGSQMALLENSLPDTHQPMFGGMRRLLRRIAVQIG